MAPARWGGERAVLSQSSLLGLLYLVLGELLGDYVMKFAQLLHVTVVKDYVVAEAVNLLKTSPPAPEWQRGIQCEGWHLEKLTKAY